MKIFIYLCLVLALSSCTNFQSMNDTIIEKNTWSSVESLKRDTIILNDTASEGILNDISTSLKRGYVKEYNNTLQESFEVYAGDYVSIPLVIGEDSYNMFYYPLGTSYEIKLVDGKLLFRSIYQGKYEIMLYSVGSFSRKIKIENRLKYEFTEQNNYDVIARNYANGNLKVLEDSIAVHRIAFPNSFRDKELSFMLINLAGKDGNSRIIKNEIDFLQKYTKLSEDDKLVIMNSLNLINNSDIQLSSEFLNFDREATVLNSEIAKFIMKKNNVSQEEIVFLEKYYETLETPDITLGNFIGNWYINNGNMLKGAQYLNKNESSNIIENITGTVGEIIDNGLSNGQISGEPKETPATTEESLEAQNYTQYLSFLKVGKENLDRGNYLEALVYLEKASAINREYIEQKDLCFYMGQSYFGAENYSEAVKYFKNSLNLEKNDEKKAEIYYNIGMSYDKLGDKNQAINYLTYVRQNYNSSQWSVKSSLYLLQQLGQNPSMQTN